MSLVLKSISKEPENQGNPPVSPEQGERELTFRIRKTLGQLFTKQPRIDLRQTASDENSHGALSKNEPATAPEHSIPPNAAGTQTVWESLVAACTAELVRESYQALMGRDPDESGRAAYEALLGKTRSLSSVLLDLIGSSEFWNKTIARRSSELVRQLFLGVLGREPDPDEAAAYNPKMSKTEDISALLAELGVAKRSWAKLCSDHSGRLVQEAFKGLFDREPEDNALQEYSEKLNQTGDLAQLLATLIESREFSELRIKRRPVPNPARWFNNPCMVFLHIQKTAGTSIQNHLRDCFGKKQLFREHANTLHVHAPGELAKFNVYAGHFNYDSLRFIPRETLSIFTFLREPKQRLISLYYFLRAHEPTHKGFNNSTGLANQLDIEDFFEAPQMHRNPGFHDHMCWAIMGHSQWKKWMKIQEEMKDAEAFAGIVEKAIRPEIERRLREFIFIGLREDFDRSVELLFRTMGREIPLEIREDHSLELLMTRPDFKKSMEKQAVTPRLDAAIELLIQLDQVVYEEGKKIYEEQLLKPVSRVIELPYSR